MLCCHFDVSDRDIQQAKLDKKLIGNVTVVTRNIACCQRVGRSSPSADIFVVIPWFYVEDEEGRLCDHTSSDHQKLGVG